VTDWCPGIRPRVGRVRELLDPTRVHNPPMISGGRPGSHPIRAGGNRAGWASSNWHYYQVHAENRRRNSALLLLPRKVRDLNEQLDDAARTTVSDVGLQLAEAVDESKPLEGQLDELAEIWQEQFAAIVEPLLESMKDEIAAAVNDAADQAEKREPKVPEVGDEQRPEDGSPPWSSS